MQASLELNAVYNYNYRLGIPDYFVSIIFNASDSWYFNLFAVVFNWLEFIIIIIIIS